MPVFVKGDKKILFIHIPKAGGSSIEAAFRKSGFFMHFHDHGPKKINSINPFMKCSPQHFYAEQINNIFNLNSFDEIFTIVRHPEKRFLSEFAMRYPLLEKPTIENIDVFLKKCTDDYHKNPFVYDNHIRPQSEFIVHSTKIFKLEEGMDKIQNYFYEKHKIELKIEKKLSSSKLKIGESSKLPINNIIKEQVNTFYKKDFELFKYKD